MSNTLTSYATWLDLVADLANGHVDPFPRALVADLLFETFDCEVSWNWMDDDGGFGVEFQQPHPGFPSSDEAEIWASGGLASHPLVCWYLRTGDPTPTTVGRVPREMVPAAGFGMLEEMLGPYGWEQQLSIPYDLGAGRYRAFVLARQTDDFTDQEVDLARRLHPLLAVLERQGSALHSRPRTCETAGLTARELAVLVLLRDGLTAVAIGHRLRVSPRTVHTHLRSIYRKLRVTDRMRAVLVAQELGVLPASGTRHAVDSGVPLPQRWVSPRPFRLP